MNKAIASILILVFFIVFSFPLSLFGIMTAGGGHGTFIVIEYLFPLVVIVERISGDFYFAMMVFQYILYGMILAVFIYFEKWFFGLLCMFFLHLILYSISQI